MRKLFLMVFVSVLVLAGYVLMGGRHKADTDGVSTPAKVSFSNSCIGTGIHVDEYLKGKKVFSLKMDSLGVVGKKAGFFRLGFWKVARLKNVSLDLYHYPPDAGQHKSDGSLNTPGVFPDMGKLFSKSDKLRQMIPTNVRGIEISNIKIRMHKDWKLISTVSSDSARIDSRGNGLTFEGDVKVASNNGKILKCEKMHWSSDTKRFKVNGAYVLTVSGETMRGKGIQTDYGFNNIRFVGRRTWG